MHTNYHTQHSPFGAFASFTIGLHNSPGGFGQALGGPANQNIYAGFRRKSDPRWNLLPFFKGTKSQLAAFTGEQAVDTTSEPYRQFALDEFGRKLGWASDQWNAGPFTFSIHTPFDHVPDPATFNPEQGRFFTAPVLPAAISFDNSGGNEDVEMIFGLSDSSCPARTLKDSDPGLCGFAIGHAYGYATVPAEGVQAIQGLSVLKQEFSDFEGLHRLGCESALVITVPAGAKRTVPIALGFYEAGQVTTGIDCSYFYTRYFSKLEDVLSHGLQRTGEYVALANKRDAELESGALSPEQRWLLAQATHSYYGSSELLTSGEGIVWVVNEGEYRMINTFDLTVDHLFFEMEWHPWAVRYALDLFVDRYSYRDTIQSPNGETAPGGISFTHDMGIANQFTPEGRSSYECWNIHGCFSQMTMEQLVNWVCCAVTYGLKFDRDWLRKQRDTLLACKASIENRDHPDPKLRNGLMKWDSGRCGSGSEITTYDSLDISLGQARNNLYLAVKTFSAWLLLERAFVETGDTDESKSAAFSAERIARTLSDCFETETGFFPAVFEKGNRSRILPAVEGLVFVLYLGLRDTLDRFPVLLAQLEQHMTNALRPAVCIDVKSGGWQISSTSKNTWFSKIALAQHVARMLFPKAISTEAAASDASHVAWEQGEGCARWAMCDQIHSETGVALGSKYYPRGVTAILWMRE